MRNFPIYKQRIKKNKEYKEVYNKKKKYSFPNIILFIGNKTLKKEDTLVPKFGLVINKKVGNSVRRKRVKRIIIEALKISGYNFPENNDYILFIKQQNNLYNLDDCLKELDKITKKLQ